MPPGGNRYDIRRNTGSFVGHHDSGGAAGQAAHTGGDFVTSRGIADIFRRLQEQAQLMV
jgi:hypothetical protein